MTHPNSIDGVIITVYSSYADLSPKQIIDLMKAADLREAHSTTSFLISGERPTETALAIIDNLGPLRHHDDAYVAGEDPRPWVIAIAQAISPKRHDVHFLTLAHNRHKIQISNLFDQDVTDQIPLSVWTPSILQISLWPETEHANISRYEVELPRPKDIPLLERMAAIRHVSEKIGLEPSEWMGMKK